MKTAQEWMERAMIVDGHWHSLFDQEKIKEIQLDAIKHGMTLAYNLKPDLMSEETYGATESFFRQGYNAGTAAHASAIIEGRDSLTQIPE